MSETLTQYAPNHDITNLAAASLSAAPDLTEAERTARFQTVVRATKAFQPTDPTQTLLATLILGHHLAIMDGFRDIACLTLTPTEAARARMVTVAQTKLVLQMAREMRIARKDALAQRAAERTTANPSAAGHGEPAPEPAQGSTGDAGYEASLDKFLSAYAETLATLENTDTLTPAAAEMTRQALSQVLSPAPGATSRAANADEANSSSGLATGSRAQRRATMKRRGEFKRAA